jgi:hypothetical protein
LSCKTGPDLTIAAAAYLTIVMNISTFGRSELLPEMKSATAYYHKNFESNFSQNMRSLQKAEALREVSKGKYALTAPKLEELKSSLLG